MFGMFKNWRRRRIYQQPIPQDWLSIIQQNVPYYRKLPPELQKKLQGYVQLFIDEKGFEGCGGLQLNDEVKITIAAQACILLLGWDVLDIFPSLTSVLVYPDAYFAPVDYEEEGGIVVEGEEFRSGEAWSHGNIVLAWNEIKENASGGGYNLVLHEFAHQLDYDYAATETISEKETDTKLKGWVEVLSREYEKHVESTQKKRKTLIDDYGALNMAEFFAVATETFFERPKAMKRKHPELYHQLSLFYEQDPASY